MNFSSTPFVHGNWYATSATWLGRRWRAGQDVLLEIDWQGAAQVRRLIPDSVHIFILPPSIEALKERLTKRGQDPPEVIEQRLAAAREEMRHCGEFDYVIMNQDFARAVDDLSVIVRAARLTAPRQQRAPREGTRTTSQPRLLERSPWHASRSTTVSPAFPTASS